MVDLAQQLVSVDCWTSTKCAEFQLKWQFQQSPLKAFTRKCIRKNGRLCDTNRDLSFGVIKKTPHK